MSTWTDGFEQAVRAISADYEARRPPFDVEHSPEARAVRDVDGEEERTRFLTFTGSLDYHRASDQHHEPMADLRERSPWVFDPAAAPSRSPDRLREELRTAYLRYPTKDADIWHAIATTLATEFDGRVTTLLEVADDDELVHSGAGPATKRDSTR